MRTLLRWATAFVLTLAILSAQTVKPEYFRNHKFQPLVAVPTTPTVLITGATDITLMRFTNTSASTVTVTLSDTTSTLVFFVAAIPAGGNVEDSLTGDPLTVQGGVTWGASASGVTGYVSYRQ